jgi:D-alanyl-D-alanine carboxypeptidase
LLLTYPKETVVAEKFEAMVKLGMANSRMKEFRGLKKNHDHLCTAFALVNLYMHRKRRTTLEA